MRLSLLTPSESEVLSSCWVTFAIISNSPRKLSWRPAQISAFGMGDFSRVEEEHGIGFASVDMQCAGLVRVAEHLHDAGQVVMSEVAAKAGVCLTKHLRGLKTFHFADDNVFHVIGYGTWG